MHSNLRSNSRLNIFSELRIFAKTIPSSKLKAPKLFWMRKQSGQNGEEDRLAVCRVQFIVVCRQSARDFGKQFRTGRRSSECRAADFQVERSRRLHNDDNGTVGRRRPRWDVVTRKLFDALPLLVFQHPVQHVRRQQQHLRRRWGAFNSSGRREGHHPHLNHFVGHLQQPVGRDQRRSVSQAASHQQLLPRFTGCGRSPRGRLRHELQRDRRADRQMELRISNLRSVELSRHSLLHRFDASPLLHRRRPLLRDRASTQVHLLHDGQGGGLHDRRGVDGSNAHFISADLLRVVHNRRTPSMQFWWNYNSSSTNLNNNKNE